MELVVARQSPAGQIGVGVFLVDLGCLGVKNAYGVIVESDAAYSDLLGRMLGGRPMLNIELNQVARIVRDAIAYEGISASHPTGTTSRRVSSWKAPILTLARNQRQWAGMASLSTSPDRTTTCGTSYRC